MDTMNRQGDDSADTTDPVCGMQVEQETAAGASKYEGSTYYFCSSGCKRQFDTNPQRYIGQLR